MDPRLQRRIQRYGWDKAAAHYERSWQSQLEPAQRKLLELARLAPAERVVDIACGTGLVTFAAGDVVGPRGAVVGVDVSDEMVSLARARAAARRDDHVRFERMDAGDLKLSANSFDVALSALGLMYVTDARAAIAEMTRVLVPGGRAVAAVWGQRSRCGWAEIFPIVDARVLSEVCPMFFSLGTADRLASVFAAAGLTHVVTERIDTHLEWPTGEDACHAAFASGPVALAYSRFDEGTRVDVHNEYLESIAPWREGAGYRVPGEFVIVAGEKPSARNLPDARASQN